MPRKCPDPAATSKTKVAVQFTWTAVKERAFEGESFFDVWKWDIFKRRWVRLAQLASGFGCLNDAIQCARRLNHEIQTALDIAKTNPPPLKTGH